MPVADCFFGQKLHGIFHSGIKLLADQFVAGLCAVQFLYGCRISLLGAVGVEPQSFDGFIQCFLFVEQSQLTGLILKFGFFYGTFGLSVVKDWDTDAESDGVVPSVFHLLAEGEVASAGMVGTDTGCQADAGQISRFGDSDPQFRCLYTELACLYFRAEGYSGTKDIRFGGEGDSTFSSPNAGR